MSIVKLSGADTRLLNSGQVITDVCSIVKELIENALDASANSIVVTLEGHGLNQITVRDDGVGVPAVDRDRLARMAHTSKLSTFADLAVVRSYGFRGQALASLLEVAQKLIVTTRTKYDTVASVYEACHHNELMPTRTSADPRGTTVVVKKPWYRLPVRREAFKKHTNKIIPSLKSLIDSFSFIWPQIRFQLVIKADRKGDPPMIHTRLSQHSMLQSAMAAYGGKMVQNYQVVEHDYCGYQLTCLLPRPGSSISPPAAKPQIYVDKRPMSCIRDTPKLVLSSLKQYITHFCPDIDKNLFLLLNIQCPLSSYDPNVEPSKDNVFFEQEQIVLEAVQSMLKSFYGDVLGEKALAQIAETCPVSDLSTAEHGTRAGNSVGTSDDKGCYEDTTVIMQHLEDNGRHRSTSPTLNNNLPSLMRGSPLRLRARSGPSELCQTATPGDVVSSSANESDSSALVIDHGKGWSFSMFDDGIEDSSDVDFPSTAPKVVTNDEALTADESHLLIDVDASSEENVADYVSDRPILTNPWSIARMAKKRSLPSSTSHSLRLNDLSNKFSRTFQGPMTIQQSRRGQHTQGFNASQRSHALTQISPSASRTGRPYVQLQPTSITRISAAEQNLECPGRSVSGESSDLLSGQSKITQYISGSLLTKENDENDSSRLTKKPKVYHIPGHPSPQIDYLTSEETASEILAVQQGKNSATMNPIDKHRVASLGPLKLESTARHDMVHNLSRDMVTTPTNTMSPPRTSMYSHNFPALPDRLTDLGFVLTTGHLKTFPGELSLWIIQHQDGISLHAAKKANHTELTHDSVLASVRGEEGAISSVRLW